MLNFKGSTILFIIFVLVGCSNNSSRERLQKYMNEQEQDLASLGMGGEEISVVKGGVFEEKISKEKTVPPEDKLPTTLVSIGLDGEVPLKDALIGLSEAAGVDIEICPEAVEKVTFFATQRPFRNVLSSLCSLGHLRYSFSGEILKIVPDKPYVLTYSVPFLSVAREEENHLSVATDVFASFDGGGKKMDNGSHSILNSKVRIDFWEEISNVLVKLVNDYAGSGKVGGNSGNTDKGTAESNFTLHRQAGLITVSGSSLQHEMVADYLNKLERTISTQVLIEAKVIEVCLHDQFKSGINWKTLTSGDLKVAVPLVGSLDVRNASDMSRRNFGPKNMVTVGVDGKSVSALLQFIKTFGELRTLSNPRMTVLNNQPAVLKVAENKIFFRIKYDRHYLPRSHDKKEQSDWTTVQSEVQTIPVGFVMTVQPSIDIEKQTVILTLRPTVTRVTSFQEDPAVSIVSNNSVTSVIPVVEIGRLYQA
ncbi:MAG: hypothetical protein HON43_05170 [Alphaproteobacteria bacterium]|nr:hypothetical protein [Alphaproteobacteria bacterium]MBT5389578.1 hypothetical protein [Alphaproteobacteria bacterium]MBT5541017.1 hypothetical protein [Alphaproteobacteria bacterium]